MFSVYLTRSLLCFPQILLIKLTYNSLDQYRKLQAETSLKIEREKLESNNTSREESM
jgi:hypothetical protein